MNNLEMLDEYKDKSIILELKDKRSLVLAKALKNKNIKTTLILLPYGITSKLDILLLACKYLDMDYKVIDITNILDKVDEVISKEFDSNLDSSIYRMNSINNIKYTTLKGISDLNNFLIFSSDETKSFNDAIYPLLDIKDERIEELYINLNIPNVFKNEM